MQLVQLGYRSTMNLLKQDNLFSDKIPKFEHGLEIGLSDGRKVFASYHPSPRNTQTGKLTANMFSSLFQGINRGLGQTSYLRLRQVKPLGGLKLVLFSLFNFLENDFPFEIEILAVWIV